MQSAELTTVTGTNSLVPMVEQGASSSAVVPLVYSCSGCSSAAQMANDLAIWLDRAGLAEMSCIAGVGGGVGSLVRTALSGRPIVTIDGCTLKCCQACLDGIDLAPDLALVLTRLGVPKVRRATYDAAQAQRIYAMLQRELRALDASRRAPGVGSGRGSSE